MSRCRCASGDQIADFVCAFPRPPHPGKPSQFSPSKPPSGSGWLVASKHDGYRIQAVKRGGKVRLWSRNGRDWSVEFAAITAALVEWDVGSVVLGR